MSKVTVELLIVAVEIATKAGKAGDVEEVLKIYKRLKDNI